MQFSQHAASRATSGQTIVKQRQPQQAQHTQHAAVESSSQQSSANGSIQGAEGSEATGVNSDAEFPVEFIMAHKPDNGCMKAGGKLYKVKWAGCADITWEPFGCFEGSPLAMHAYCKQAGLKMSQALLKKAAAQMPRGSKAAQQQASEGSKRKRQRGAETNHDVNMTAKRPRA